MKKYRGISVKGLWLALILIAPQVSGFSAAPLHGRDPQADARHFLEKAYPMAREVHWSMQGDLITAEFQEGIYGIQAQFDRQGNWVATLSHCEGPFVPFALQVLIDKKFAGYKPYFMTDYRSAAEHRTFMLLRALDGNIVRWLRIRMDDRGRIQVLERLQQRLLQP